MKASARSGKTVLTMGPTLPNCLMTVACLMTGALVCALVAMLTSDGSGK